MKSLARALVWFRRDLRDHDHAALATALASAQSVYCVFVREPRDDTSAGAARRAAFVDSSVRALDDALRARGGRLIIASGFPRELIADVASRLQVQAVYVNREYEPGTRARDELVRQSLAERGIAFHEHDDHVLFTPDEIRSRAGRPFTVFTPYRKAWRAALDERGVSVHNVEGDGMLASPGRLPGIASVAASAALPDLTAPFEPGMHGAQQALGGFLERIDAYDHARDFPATDGTSRLSVHLRFGTLSVRAAARAALTRIAMNGGSTGADKWLDELAWRDFFVQLMYHHPHVIHAPFRSEYASVPWRDDDDGFAAWRAGRTGYPFVDAGMRELASTGWMHNRLRMVAASFLVKDLLIDWRRGEHHFAQQLLDHDLASNNGGWQWAASTGCDAQPWFRVFNPVTQSQRFDPDGSYTRRYVPELASLPDRHIHAPWQLTASEQARHGVVIGRDYPAPIVEHEGARQRALDAFAAAARSRRSGPAS